MSTAATPTDLGQSRRGWHTLTWIVPLTALWIATIYALPIIPTSGIQTTMHQLSAHALIALGLWLGLERSNLTPDQRRTLWLAVMIPDTLWFAVVWCAAVNGVFVTGTASLPLLPAAILLPVIVGGPLLLSSRRVGQVLDVTPASWLVALQLYRVFGSWFVAAWLRGAAPPIPALPAGFGDIVTGVFAVPAAIAVAAGTAQGRRGAIAWNLLGLTDFVVAITLGMLTTPGRLQLIVPAMSSFNAGIYPDVLTPAFVVPSSILLHALSLRQLLRKRHAGAAALPIRWAKPKERS